MRSPLPIIVVIALAGLIYLAWPTPPVVPSTTQPATAPTTPAFAADGATPDRKPLGRDSISWLRLQPSTPRASRQELDDANLVGRLLDATGNPLAGVTVVRVDRGSGPGRVHNSTTAEDGTFGFSTPSVVAGNIILARGESWVLENQRKKFEITAEQPTADLGDLVAAPAASIRGRVLGPGGNPVAGATIEIKDGVLGTRSFRRELTCNPLGQFEIRGLRATKYEVEVHGAGLLARQDSIQLASGEQLANLQWTLAAGSKISGVVRDAEGTPIAGVNVRRKPAGFDTGSTGRSAEGLQRLTKLLMHPHWRATTSGADGSFSILHPGQEPLEISFGSTGYVTQRLSDLHPPQTGLDVTLLAAGMLNGRVLDAAGAPIEGAHVTAVNTNTNHWMQGQPTLTDADGRFQCEGIQPGRWALHVSHDLYRRENSRAYDVVPGSQQDALITLQRATTIAVHIVDARGAAIPRGRAWIRTRGPAPKPSEMVFSTQDPRLITYGLANGEGTVYLKSLDAGSYLLGASAPNLAGAALMECTIPQPAGPQAPPPHFTIALRDGEHADLEAVDHLGGSLAGVNYEFSGPAEEELDVGLGVRGATDKNGKARIGPLPPGTYSVWLSLPRHSPTAMAFPALRPVAGTETTFAVRAGAPTKVRITALEPAMLTGIVTAGQQPAADCSVELLPSDPKASQPILVDTTDAKGAFSFFAVNPGEYRLRYRRGSETPRETSATVPGPGAKIQVSLPLEP